mgnify:FL=1|jgi:vanillate O-demethylase monooxygenase subunit
MFLSTEHSQRDQTLPRDCTFRPSDWHKLAAFWHPVAFGHDVVDQPVAAKLLDLNLVIYRTSSGVTVADDQCPHRGVRLSMGRIQGENLVCAMHGLHYDGQGRCTRIPSVQDSTRRIPKKLCLNTYSCVERYGIIWTCLKSKAVWPLPDWPQLETSASNRHCVPTDEWQASAPRHVENFNDIAHFPWVHIDSFGGEEGGAFPPYKVKTTKYGLTFSVPYLEGFNRFPDGVEGDEREVEYTYQLTFPFSTLLLVKPVDSDYVHYFADSVCPVSSNKTKIFQVFTDSQGVKDPDFWLNDALTINSEDKALVESQQPFELPLDTRDELHIPADKMARSYRKSLVSKFGLGLSD